jgi:X-Pro dipeptidyl-peptidase
MLWRGILCAVLALCAWAAPAMAAPPVVLGPDGTSAPVFDYEQAIRERVYIPQPGIDQDLDGALDWIAVEVMRPKESGPGLERPAIVDASPYYSTICRGNEGECIADVDADGRNDRWPLFVDNYFVPRGYAYVLAEMNGTANSQGCPMHGSAGDIAGMKSVVDWLAGRIAAFDQPFGNPVLATWSSGSVAMIGKSYDGTLANGVAATGVQGLKTIIPISAISDWYRYSRQNGVVYSGWNNHYAAYLSNLVTDAGRRSACAAARNALNAADGDDTGDMNPFWSERDYSASADKVKAAVFATHGFQDDNVKLDHFGAWWAGLAANDVPRKLWLLRGGHVDPFDSRRAEWVGTLHRWLDHWLLGIDNGIMGEPRVSVEESANTWQDYADWPLPGSTAIPIYLRGTTADTAGGLGLSSGGPLDSVSWVDMGAQTETAIIDQPQGAQVRRRVFLSAPLQAPLRISGTPVVDIRAALSTARSNLGAVLVDYGPSTQTTRNGEGIANTTERDCWGKSTTREYPPGTIVDHGACYLKVTKPQTNVTQWRFSRGILDSQNRNSLTSIEPVTPGTSTRFSWPLIPQEHVIPAGHQLGIVLVANYSGVGVTPSPNPAAAITLDTKASTVLLPVVGGYRAAAATRAFSPDTTAPVMSGVPDDIAVDVADPAGAVVDYAPPTATDDETPDPEVVCSPAPGTRFPVGATQVTCKASDAYGNETVRAFTVTVVDTSPDTTPPVLSAPADVAVAADDPGGATVAYTLPTATDDKTASPLVVCDPAPGTKFPIGATTVTCTATDDAGNAAARAFTVTVAPLPDTTPPVLVGMPGDLVVDGEGGAGGILAYTLPTATDDRTAHPVVVCDPAPGKRMPVGAHRVTCTATDAAGNVTTSGFTVTVVGPGSPPPTDGGGGGRPPTGDTVPDADPDADSTAPRVRVLRVTPRGRVLRVRIRLSEAARVRVVVKRGGRVVARRTVRMRAGRRVVALRATKLPRGRYAVSVVARDAAGNAGPAVTKRLRRR